jgi:hypothetical protein
MLCAYGRYKAEIINGEDVLKGCHNRDRIVIGFTTTYAVSVYHH